MMRQFVNLFLVRVIPRLLAVGGGRNAKSIAKGGLLLSGACCVLKRDRKVEASEPPTLDLSMFMCQPISDMETLKNSNQAGDKMEAMIMALQAKLCRAMEEHEATKKFRVDRWLKKKGQEGGGITCVMEDGAVFERAAVNISVINGKLTPNAVKLMNSSGKTLPDDEDELPFKAIGISSVIHPRNPMVPTLHFNYRYFEVKPEHSAPQWWFGGGCDLTPYYLDEDDAKHFHQTLKRACDPHGAMYYKKFKKWCDDYFFLPHRCERRGVGGIFFDDIKSESPCHSYKFIKACADAVIPSYMPIVEKHKNDSYGIRERDWQLLRRGRYVEFNLVYDRGTKFGFHTPGARFESILVSMPRTAKWEYCHCPEPGTPEADLMEVLKNPREWLKRTHDDC